MVQRSLIEFHLYSINLVNTMLRVHMTCIKILIKRKLRLEIKSFREKKQNYISNGKENEIQFITSDFYFY